VQSKCLWNWTILRIDRLKDEKYRKWTKPSMSGFLFWKDTYILRIVGISCSLWLWTCVRLVCMISVIKTYNYVDIHIDMLTRVIIWEIRIIERNNLCQYMPSIDRWIWIVWLYNNWNSFFWLSDVVALVAYVRLVNHK